jgi:hypothetical protein
MASGLLLPRMRVVEVAMDGGHPLHQGAGIVHQGVGGNADGRIGAERLDEERHPEVAAGLEPFRLREDREARIENPLVVQQLLAEALVLAEIEVARTAAGVAHFLGLQQCRHQHVAHHAVAEHLGHVEDQLRLPARQSLQELGHVAEERQDRDAVAQLPEGAHHLRHDHVQVFLGGPHRLDRGAHGDLHSSSPMPQRANAKGSPP